VGYGKWEKLGGLAMIGEVIANTNVIRYLMAAMGILGVIAKLVNQVTLNRLIRAAGTMSKSTHRLIKLVKAKYEHACMVHDTVENTDAFVEKYIYEYRGFLFKIHTWRQIEILTVWFSGILALSGASADYLYYGAVESVYQYIAVGAAEMILLEVIRRMSDEPYKIQGKNVHDRLSGQYLCSPSAKTKGNRKRGTECDRIGKLWGSGAAGKKGGDCSCKAGCEGAGEKGSEQKIVPKAA
jgi:hypothetical protein